MNRSSETAVRGWFTPNSTFVPALTSSLACWLAFPPVGWGLLAWIAPVGWLSLVLREELPRRRPYRALWFAGFVFWLLTVHWIRLPHLANYLAWLVLSSYLGCYLPLFVALSRIGVHCLKWPLWIIAPVVWTGLDWLRGHLMTGFLMGSLAHTQVDFLDVIQIACLAGEYGVTFQIIFAASCLTHTVVLNQHGFRQRFMPLAFCLGVLFALVTFGAISLTGVVHYNRSVEYRRLALVQGNTLADWKANPDKQQKIMQEYMGLSLKAVEQSRELDNKEVDVVVWPETTFRQTLASVADGYQPPPELVHESYFTAAQIDLAEFVRQTDTAILTGIDRVHILPDVAGHPDYEAYNSSVLMNKQKQIVGTYDKMHRVPFGEYIPFAEWFPLLYQITPVTGGVHPGQQPAVFDVDDFLLAPNICYETCVPHLIRRQIKQLAAANDRVPDVMVNLTNDAWYWGSSELDMHLACGIFRAVEMRIPLVVAANGGLSAYIDPYGKVRQVTERQQPSTLLVDLPKRANAELTYYARFGDWFAGLCVVCCVVLAVIGWRARKSPT